jgi:hypothetical protein
MKLEVGLAWVGINGYGELIMGEITEITNNEVVYNAYYPPPSCVIVSHVKVAYIWLEDILNTGHYKFITPQKKQCLIDLWRA